jgi:hypothetical protein
VSYAVLRLFVKYDFLASSQYDGSQLFQDTIEIEELAGNIRPAAN